MTTIWGPGPTEYRFFWHSELAHFTSEEEAKTFVERYQDDPFAMTDFQRLVDPLGGISSDEDELIDTIARMLSGGQLIAEINSTDSFEPMWQYYAPFRDRPLALNFLARFRRDPIAVALFRGLLRQMNPGANLSLQTVDQVFAGLANLLGTGRLVPGFRLHAMVGSTQ